MATLHTANETIREPRGVSVEMNVEDRIISKNVWPPRSPDLNSCDFYLGENSKVLCMPTIRMTWRLKQNIRETICNIQQRELKQDSRNLSKRIQACLTAEGRHFEH
jgi:hypothetical protein